MPPPTSTTTHKFTGKERDTESGLDFFIARYYSSGHGRFLSPDEFTGGPVDAFSASDPLPPGPLPYADITNPQSLNKYSYTYNNPLNHIDPDGHNPIWILLQRILTHPATQRAVQAGQRYASNATGAVQRWGTAAYNVATRFLNSPKGQDAIQTALELATGAQLPSAPKGAIFLDTSVLINLEKRGLSAIKGVSGELVITETVFQEFVRGTTVQKALALLRQYGIRLVSGAADEGEFEKVFKKLLDWGLAPGDAKILADAYVSRGIIHTYDKKMIEAARRLGAEIVQQ